MMASAPNDKLQDRRKRAVRTALVLAVLAVAVFVAFILTGILGSP